jgi:TRAP-type C4-dicarboxylate transport system permease small subunit
LNVRLAAVSGVLILVMVGVVIYDVVLRYAFSAPTIWAFDVSRFLLAYVAFFGLALALQDGTHVSVDLFLEMVGTRVGWWMRLVAHLLTIAFGLVLTWQVSLHTAESIAQDWLSPTMLAVPLKYVYVAGPLGCGLFTLTAIVLSLQHVNAGRLALAETRLQAVRAELEGVVPLQVSQSDAERS